MNDLQELLGSEWDHRGVGRDDGKQAGEFRFRPFYQFALFRQCSSHVKPYFLEKVCLTTSWLGLLLAFWYSLQSRVQISRGWIGAYMHGRSFPNGIRRVDRFRDSLGFVVLLHSALILSYLLVSRRKIWCPTAISRVSHLTPSKLWSIKDQLSGSSTGRLQLASFRPR